VVGSLALKDQEVDLANSLKINEKENLIGQPPGFSSAARGP
jgi:hypothetical protein